MRFNPKQPVAAALRGHRRFPCSGASEGVAGTDVTSTLPHPAPALLLGSPPFGKQSIFHL